MPTRHDTPAAADAMRQAEPLIHSLITRLLPSLKGHDRDDLAQDVRLHLWSKALIDFDPTRASWKSYAFLCIRSFVRSARLKRQRERRLLQNEHEDRIVAQAEVPLPDPKGVLTPRQLQVYIALQRGGQREQREIAHDLGLHPVSLCQIKRRIFERLQGAMLNPALADRITS